MARLKPEHAEKTLRDFQMMMSVCITYWEMRENELIAIRKRLEAKTSQSADKRFIDGVKWALMVLDEETFNEEDQT